MRLRDRPRREDANRLRRIAELCGNFSAAELGYVAEIVSRLRSEGARRSGYRLLVQEDDAGPAAFVLWGPRAEANEGDLYWIATHERARGRGLGRALIAETERRAAAEGIAALFIETESGDAYGDARRLYAAAGYEIARTEADHYGPGRDLVIYRKALARESP